MLTESCISIQCPEGVLRYVNDGEVRIRPVFRLKKIRVLLDKKRNKVQ